MRDAERFKRIAGSIHVHTSFSGGRLKPKEAVSLAREKGVKVLAITDYSDRKWEYRGIGINKPSVLKFGTEKYLEEIGLAANENPDMIVMGGVEASPFYYWEGSFLKPVCRDCNKHILVLGVEEPDKLGNLPLLARRNSGYDQYSGSQGIEPYQKLIGYVNLHGGLTFWAHPEMEDNFRYLNARLYTPPYVEDLRRSFGYTGFSVLPRGEGMANPGGCWDEVLSDYCEGRREKPVWAIAETDYRKEEDDISNPATVFVNEVKDKEDVLEALRKGNVYALDSPRKGLFLNYFEIRDEKASGVVSMGGTLPDAANSVTVRVDIESKAPLKKVVLVRDGTVVEELDEKQFEFRDNLSSLRKKVFYRLVVEDVQGSRLFSNPIFVNRE